MAQHGKRYLEARKLVDSQKSYTPQEAVALAKQTSNTKFDASVEIHLRTGADPKHADQQVRGVALLPHGLGKTVRVLVFAQGDAARRAQEAGADFIGDDETIKKIEEGWVDFEVAIATPDVMGKVGRLGRVLGRRGLMPNPRSGTVVQPDDVAKAVGEARKGRVEFRLDRTGVIHGVVGKVSFDEDKLMDNLATFVDAVNQAKPTGVKGSYLRGASLASAMGPGIKLDVPSTAALKPK
jgi:large subunit ribosomal protein L1